MCGDRARLALDERGTTALEFAIVLPIFILMLFGGIQFGWAQHVSGSVAFALEKAGRAMVLNPAMTEAAVQSFVASRLDGGVAANVTVTMTTSTGADGAMVARLTGVYSDQIGLPGLAAIPFQSTRVVIKTLPTT